MRVSHSAINKYLACARMYDLHYNKKIRPTWTSSALLFGDAMDKGLNELVQRTDKDANEVFIKSWTNGMLNKQPIYIPTCIHLLYANKDYEPNLLTQKDFDEIKTRVDSGEVKEFDFDELIAKKKKTSWNSFTNDEKAYYNLVNWYCMKNKAYYMFEGYKKKVLPLIGKVHCVQKEISADNGAGGALSGFIDLIADVEGYGTVVLDHKTSARDYEWDSPSKSSQLALYMHMEGPNYNTNKAGFIVLKKNLNYNKIKICNKCHHDGTASRAKTCDNQIDGKRCTGIWNETISPEAEFQILIQTMPKAMEEMTIDNIDTVTQAIATGIFPMNTNTCENYFGSKCSYFDYCNSKGKNMKGLCSEN